MVKKKAMKKANTAMPKPFLLANNPRNDNSCKCFVRKVPSNEWIVIARYPSMAQCQKTITQCSNFFMMSPIKKPHKKAHKTMKKAHKTMKKAHKKMKKPHRKKMR